VVIKRSLQVISKWTPKMQTAWEFPVSVVVLPQRDVDHETR
jgi:hypothetical protein